ncbi:Mlr4354 like protein [invertebrate metagenome]|uniref:Mlr4354 like protein n=1 Tax=invertebrate metagenome TaxID=1711999 RepID=A0A484H855_9ZZZZ
MKLIGKVILTCVAIAVTAVPETARTQQNIAKLGTNGVWTAYTAMEQGNRICYTVARPIHSEGNYSRRGDVYAIVTHRPSRGSYGIFSIMAGYPYQSNAYIHATIDNRQFTLIGHGETAWLQGTGDADLVAAMQGGREMTVIGYSQRGTRTVDIFELMGFTASHTQIDKACPESKQFP